MAASSWCTKSPHTSPGRRRSPRRWPWSLAAAAVTSCTIPAAGKPTFEIGEGEMELGVGIHGEAGRRRVPLAPADIIAAELTAAVLDDLQPRKDEPLLLLVNGFGGTPLLELYLMYETVSRRLE